MLAVGIEMMHLPFRGKTIVSYIQWDINENIPVSLTQRVILVIPKPTGEVCQTTENLNQF